MGVGSEICPVQMFWDSTVQHYQQASRTKDGGACMKGSVRLGKHLHETTKGRAFVLL